MSNKTTSVKAGFPFLTILGLIFITLKLADIGVVATWSWWWVLSPFWLPLLIAVGMIVIVYLWFLLFSK